MRTKKTLINFIATIVLQIVTGICGLIVPILFINEYGSEVNGLVASINQFLGYITLFEAGLSGVLMSLMYKPIAEKDYSRCDDLVAASRDYFKRIAFYFIIYVVVLAIVYPNIVSNSHAHWFVSTLIGILSVNLLIQYLFGISNIVFLQAKQEGYIYSILQAVAVILNALVVIICIRFSTSVLVLKCITIITTAVCPIGIFLWVKSRYKYINQKKKGTYKIIDQRWDGMLHHVCYYVQNNVDIVILTFVNLKLVSVYSIYYMITSTIRKVFESFLVSFRSVMGDMYAKKQIDMLKRTFSALEFLVYTLTVAVFVAVYFSLTPFIELYTRGVTDINYVNELFAVILIVAEASYAIRIPYHTLVNSTGQFKETKHLAIQEAIVNVVISLVFVYRLGLAGVALGTAVSCIYRTIRYMIFFTKNIVFLRWGKIVARVLTQIGCCTVLIMLFRFLNFESTDYLSWFIHGLAYFMIAIIVSVCVNLLVFRQDYEFLAKKVSSIFK